MRSKIAKMTKSLVILVIIILILVIPYIFKDTITIENAIHYKHELKDYVNDNFTISVIFFFIACILLVNSPLPMATVIKFLGGFLFGFTLGMIFNLIASFIGCMLGFIVSRYLFRDKYQKKYGNRLKRSTKEIKENPFFYFFLLRVLFFFPYFLNNILGGISKVPTKTYAWATFVGLIPFSILYSYGGSKLGEINSIREVFTIEVILFLVVFILIIWKLSKFKGEKGMKRALKFSKKIDEKLH